MYFLFKAFSLVIFVTAAQTKTLISGSISEEQCTKVHSVWACFISTSSLGAQMGKHLPTMQETRVQFLGQEDPLEKEMATHSSILAWKIPWTEGHVGYSPWDRKESDMTEGLHFTSSV